MRRVTINDIARESGYSKTSVSFAFNDPDRLSNTARDTILRVAEALGYEPSPAARSLTIGRHGVIGLLLPQPIPVSFLNPYLSQIVQGIGEVCESEGYTLALIPPVRASVLEGIRSAAVDGLITLGLESGSDVVGLIRRRHLPFVQIDGLGDGECPVIGVDNFVAAHAVAGHIAELGHREVAILAFPTNPGPGHGSHVREARLEGYRAGLSDGGVPLTGIHCLECESSLAGGLEAVTQLREQRLSPTAILAMSDVIAIGAMQALERDGVAVPQAVSVAGFDDIPEATVTRPRLTTVSQPGAEKGRRAAEMLADMVAGHPVDRTVTFPVELVIRESTTVAAGSRPSPAR